MKNEKQLEEKQTQIEQLQEAGTKLAQELQDMIGEAERAGCENPLPGVKEIIEEWEAVYSAAGGGWQNQIVSEETDGLIKAL